MSGSTKSAPIEYVDYIICKEFGWTISQLDDQPRDRVEQFLTIMNIERSFANIEAQKQAAANETR